MFISARFPIQRSRRKKRQGIVCEEQHICNALAAATTRSQRPQFVTCWTLSHASNGKVVCATFSAELMGACDAVDNGSLLSQMLHDISTGDCSIYSARARCDNGAYSIPKVIYIDAMSVFAAVTASYIMIPVANGMLFHMCSI